MTDIPIIFSASMVRALLEGRKTMTRRLAWRPIKGAAPCIVTPSPWQKVKPGDRLWVRENLFLYPNRDEDFEPLKRDAELNWTYTADDSAASSVRGSSHYAKGIPSIHMPRWASRLTLVVKATKIERLNDIDGIDALAEGVTPEEGVAPWRLFKRLWESLHGEGAWAANAEVVAPTFTVHQCNIDAMKVAA